MFLRSVDIAWSTAEVISENLVGQKLDFYKYLCENLRAKNLFRSKPTWLYWDIVNVIQMYVNIN